MRRACVLALAVLFGAAQAEERVAFDSLDRQAGHPLRLLGFWFAAAPAPAGAVVLLHGCGGPYDRRGD